jgi:hypothetical protein
MKNCLIPGLVEIGPERAFGILEICHPVFLAALPRFQLLGLECNASQLPEFHFLFLGQE